MTTTSVEDFRALHRRGAGFILPNAWDGGSARMLEHAGFAAIATTSAGIAFSRGRADGTMAREEMLEEIAGIVAVVECPVSADLESGYGGRPEDAAATVAAAVEIGVVGCNLEDADADGLVDVEHAVERLVAVRAAAPAEVLVLNARTDPYMTRHADAFAETVRRAHRYLDAGADCIFVPGVSDPDVIARLVAEIGAPVNVVAGLTDPIVPASALREAGVARISVGGTLTRAALTLVDRAAREMLDEGTFEWAEGLVSYGAFQARFGAS
ncbi:MAG TPA: isocitrate lyase/phosphoenolpyruvate mutase family protein [Nocardioides sp.]|nr:isocitrate lyase/phosphoenolpyruvate mutase family protein [Nocardioides sp.]